ncbi:MAG: 50S ribosomal protein L24 [Vulcanimicrobiota bacterium]
MHVKKGDKVVVLTGRDRGKQGTILEVLPKKERVVVDGVNIVKKHQKPRPPAEPEGGIKDIPAPIHVSNVKKVEAKSKSTAKKKASKKKK